MFNDLSYMNQTPIKWTTLISWPPGSPDVTPLDSFLGGYAKDIVYCTKVQDMTDQKRIFNSIVIIDEIMLQQTWQKIKYFLDVLYATNGAHIEVY